MNKITHYVIEETNHTTGESIAYHKAVRNNNNLVGMFTPHAGYTLLSVNACDTKEEAVRIAEAWSEKAANTYVSHTALECAYSPTADITFVMENHYRNGELYEQSVVSFFYGEPTEEAMEKAIKYRSLTARFD